MLSSGIARLRFIAGWIATRLSRETSGGKFIPEIDGLRFLAIFPVVMHHLLGTFLLLKSSGQGHAFDWSVSSQHSWLVHLVSHGNLGVQVFFAISGFILAVPFARQHFGMGQAPSLGSYLLRRVSRLEPTYLINLAIIFMVFVFVYRVDVASLWGHLLASACYLHSAVFGEISRISDVTWSLEVEIQFYVLAPLLALVFKVRGKLLRRAILGAAVVAGSLLTPYADPRLSLSLLNFFQYFFCGFLLADVFLVEWKERPTRTFAGDGLSLSGVLLFLAHISELAPHPLMLALSILLTFVGVFKGTVSNYLFTRPIIVTVGGMCYTIYLYHNLIINNLLPALFKASIGSGGKGLLSGFPVVSLIALPMVLILCGTLFILFERPFMKKGWYRIQLFRSWRVIPGLRLF